MASAKGARRLIVNADDFGRSASINAAVIQAHENGILTSASLMVNGDAFEEAVELAKANPKLGVGLHLSLCCGRAPSGRARGDSAVFAGLRYFFSRAARAELRSKIASQFDKFARTGLAFDHVNGHLHFHLHPAVFPLVLEEMKKRHFKAFRLTHDPLAIEWPLGRGRWCYRLSHALIFGALSRRARPILRREGIAHTANIFGLLENGRISENYVLKLLSILPLGDSELYSHPSLNEFRHELDALVSPRVQRAVAAEGIQLIRYQDL
jgi:hopanoid biosynthesis associated protein HpnK